MEKSQYEIVNTYMTVSLQPIEVIAEEIFKREKTCSQEMPKTI